MHGRRDQVLDQPEPEATRSNFKQWQLRNSLGRMACGVGAVARARVDTLGQRHSVTYEGVDGGGREEQGHRTVTSAIYVCVVY